MRHLALAQSLTDDDLQLIYEILCSDDTGDPEVEKLIYKFETYRPEDNE